MGRKPTLYNHGVVIRLEGSWGGGGVHLIMFKIAEGSAVLGGRGHLDI